jgi:hypothetical protein
MLCMVYFIYHNVFKVLFILYMYKNFILFWSWLFHYRYMHIFICPLTHVSIVWIFCVPNAAINMHIHKSLEVPAVSYFEYVHFYLKINIKLNTINQNFTVLRWSSKLQDCWGLINICLSTINPPYLWIYYMQFWPRVAK